MLNNVGGNDLLFNIGDKLNENNYVTYEGTSQLTSQIGKVWEKVDVSTNFPNKLQPNWANIFYQAINPQLGIIVITLKKNIYYSLDWGKTWTENSSTLTSTTESFVAFQNGLFVIAQDRNIYTSNDAKVWTLSFTGTYPIYSLTAGNGIFMIYSYNSNGDSTTSDYISISTDGKTWSGKTQSWGTYTYGSVKLQFVKDTFFAMPENGSVFSLKHYSTDGKTWTSMSLPSGYTDWYFRCIAYTNQLKYIAFVSYSGGGSSWEILTSSDKKNWTIHNGMSIDTSSMGIGEFSQFIPLNNYDCGLVSNDSSLLYMDADIEKIVFDNFGCHPIYNPNTDTLCINSSNGYFESRNTYTATGDLQIGGKSFLSLPIKIPEGGVKIATGSYTGTGGAGSSRPCRLTFDFIPKLVLISTNAQQIFEGKGAIFIAPQSMACTMGGTSSGSTHGGSKLTWSGTSVTWYDTCSEADTQLNVSGMVYYYIAIG